MRSRVLRGAGNRLYIVLELMLKIAYHVRYPVGDGISVLAIRANHCTFLNMYLRWLSILDIRVILLTPSKTWFSFSRNSSSSISGGSRGKDVSPSLR